MPRRTHDGLKKRCRCAARQRTKCRHPWHFSFHWHGREYRYSLDVIARARNELAPRGRGEAEAFRDRLRDEIRTGEFVDPTTGPSTPPAGQAPDPIAPLTFGDICDHYLKGHVRTPTRRPRARREIETLIALARRAEIPGAHNSTIRLEQRPIAAVTKADIEAVREWRRRVQAARQDRLGAKGGEVGTNRLLSRLRHVFSWSVAEGYLTETPFTRGSVTVVKLEATVEGPRTRRLEAGTQAALLQHADPHLRAVLMAALSTGCRVGELLSLQWSQVRYDAQGEARHLVLTASKTKTAEARIIPISSRLRAELAMRRHAPDGRLHPATAYVFGDDTGARVLDVRYQWENAVLLAHGHTPTRKRGKLTSEVRRLYRTIDLHVHDLRREFACSLLESGAALHDIQAFLGHANITTTSRYLQSAPIRLEQALARLEQQAEGFAQDSHTGAPEASRETAQAAGDLPRKSLN
jgi:integrase